MVDEHRRSDIIQYRDIGDDDFSHYWYNSYVMWPDQDVPRRLILVKPHLMENRCVGMLPVQSGEEGHIRAEFEVSRERFYQVAGTQGFPRLGYVDYNDIAPVYLSVLAGRQRAKGLDPSLVRMFIPIQDVDYEFFDSIPRVVSSRISEAVYQEIVNNQELTPTDQNDVIELELSYTYLNTAVAGLMEHSNVPHHMFEQAINKEYITLDEAMSILMGSTPERLGVALTNDIAVVRHGSRTSLSLFYRTAHVGTIKDDGTIVPRTGFDTAITTYVSRFLF